MYACYNYRSEEERDLWIRKLRLVIADECGRRRTYDFDVEFPKLYSDPHVKSMYKYTHALLLRFRHNNTISYAAAVEVLSEDPSIEVRESNWLRRSFRRSMRRIRKVPNSPEIKKEDDVDDPNVDMTTEFVGDEQQDGYSTGTVCLSSISHVLYIILTEQMLIPCLDNRLSAYLNHKSIRRDVWRRRWFILNSWLLVCFEDHTVRALVV